MAVTTKMIQKTTDRLQEELVILEEYQDRKQEVLDNENNKDYPNEKNVERLETQLEVLDNAIQGIQEVLAELENYE